MSTNTLLRAGAKIGTRDPLSWHSLRQGKDMTAYNESVLLANSI